MANGAPQAEPAAAEELPHENDQTGVASQDEGNQGSTGGAARGRRPRGKPTPGRRPATLYERWKAVFAVDKKAFGRKVLELREAWDWSQKDLHAYTGVPVTTISNLENGITDPQAELVMTMIETFDPEHVGTLLGHLEPALGGPRLPGTYSAGLRTAPPAGPGTEGEASALGQEAERVLAGLLRAVWTAQGERGARPARVTRLVALALGVAEMSDDPPPMGEPGEAPVHPPESGGRSAAERPPEG